MRTEKLIGQGAFLMAEFWKGANGIGGIDSEHIVGTTDWQTARVRFLAPSSAYSVKISLWAFGGTGDAYFDDVRIKQIPAPAAKESSRRLIDGSPWGMFTCYANYLQQYAVSMGDAGVKWQREGSGALWRDNQNLIGNICKMSLQYCLDRMPAPTDPNDPLYPITNSAEYSKYLQNTLAEAGPEVRVIEVYNEPNVVVAYTLPAYANLLNLVGKTLKSDPNHKNILMGSGGMAFLDIGYMEACLKRGSDKWLDVILFHPYCVDEALDSHLDAMWNMVDRCGRPDMALAINETGFPTWDPATGIKFNACFVSEQEQAVDIVKLHVQSIAHKISFVTYLGWNDFAPEPSDHAKNMGLIRVDGSPKPSLTAYKFMTQTLGEKPVIANWTYAADGTRVYNIQVANGKTVRVVWNAIRKADVSIDLGQTRAFLCDVFGTKLTAAPVTGVYKLTADDNPVYLVPTEEKQ